MSADEPGRTAEPGQNSDQSTDEDPAWGGYRILQAEVRAGEMFFFGFAGSEGRPPELPFGPGKPPRRDGAIRLPGG